MPIKVNVEGGEETLLASDSDHVITEADYEHDLLSNIGSFVKNGSLMNTRHG